MRKLLAAIMLVMFMAGGAFAANTVILQGGFIYIALDGASDFAWSTARFTSGKNLGMKVAEAFPQGLLLTAVSYFPPAVNATMQLREATTTGTILPTKMKAITGDALIKYFDGTRLYKPSIANADLTTPTAAVVWLEFANNPMQ